MRIFTILFISGLLLTSCEHSQVTDITAVPKDELSHKQIEEVREGSHLEIIFPEKEDKAFLQKSELHTNGCIFNSIELPLEIMLQVFTELPVKDIAKASQVCRAWYQLSEDPALWRTVRLRIHGDYAKNEATKEQAKLHMLRVYVNTLTDFIMMEQLITKYDLNKHRPFIRYQTLAYKLIKELTREIIDKQAVQGNEAAMELKIVGLDDGEYGYRQKPEIAFAYNEWLVAQGNEKAIARKVKGLYNGFYGYQEDVQAAFSVQ